MNLHLSFSGKSILRELSVQRSAYQSAHFFDAETGKQYPCFGFLCEGTLTFYAAGQTIEIPQGSLYYIPAQARYRSVYRGTPNILFYGLHMHLLPSVSVLKDRYALQRVDALCSAKTQAVFERIYTCLKSEDDNDTLRAFSAFFSFYADVLPHLKQAVSNPYPQPLSLAISYIERNFQQELSVSEIAQACFLSQSRLFALFREHLGTTPIRYANDLRLEKATEQLRTQKVSLAQIAEQNGFHSEEYFRQAFRQQAGMTPLEYRKLCFGGTEL